MSQVARQLHLPWRPAASVVRKRVMSMYTDPTRVHPTDPGHVEGNPVFTYHDVFNPDKAEVEDLKERYRKGTVGDVEVKEKLFKALERFPRRRFASGVREFASKPERVREIIVEGTRKDAPSRRDWPRRTRWPQRCPWHAAMKISRTKL